MSRRVALVLAAGEGVRFGMPKALAPWQHDGTPLALAHARARVADCDGVVLVVRAPVAASLATWGLPPGAATCISSEPAPDGPAGSLVAAVRATPLDAGDVALVTPIDLPPTTRKVVEALAAALDAHPGVAAVRPVHGGRGGHPVLVRASVLRGAYLGLELAASGGGGSPPSLRDVLRRAPGGCLDVGVEDPEVLLDFDDAHTFRRHLEGAR